MHGQHNALSLDTYLLHTNVQRIAGANPEAPP
jgi:hypothetical protein